LAPNVPAIVPVSYQSLLLFHPQSLAGYVGHRRRREEEC
jgi:hypothetical protein